MRTTFHESSTPDPRTYERRRGRGLQPGCWSRSALFALVGIVLSVAWAGPALCGWRTWHASPGGLPANDVISVLEDRGGTLWIGTLSGVCTYDGAQFDPVPEMSGQLVSHILEDRDGALWFSSTGSVTRYDGAQWRTFSVDDGLAGPWVSCMLQDRNGAMWFGTNAGASRYDGTGWRTFTTDDGLADNQVYAIMEDRTGVLWFATYAGVCRYDGATWQRFAIPDSTFAADYVVTSLLQDRNGALWFGSNRGLARFDGVSWRTFTMADGLAGIQVGWLFEDRDGAVWCWSINGAASGVSRYDGVQWRTFTTADGLAGIEVGRMEQDRSGALWFACSGAAGGGLSRYDGTDWRSFTTATTDGFLGALVACMLEDREGDLWIGTENGLGRYDGRTWRWLSTADGLAGNRVLCLLQDRAGGLWIGTDGGLSRYDGVTWVTFTTDSGLAGDRVNCMLQDHGGAMWFGTGYGLTRYDGVSWRTFTKDSGLVSNEVLSALEDRNGVLWFGCGGRPPDGGVSRYDGVQWRSLTTRDGLAAFSVYSMLEDRNGALWFGSDGVVSQFDGTSWRYFRSSDGLPSYSRILDMLEDGDGVLWFATLGGVSRYDGASWRTFTSADGLANSQVFSLLESRNGTLWFGTFTGLTAHTPDRVAPRTAFLSRPSAVSANLSPAISYVAAFEEQDILFQYSLNDEPWSTWSPTNVWPTRPLPDGRHTFRIRARDDYFNVESPPKSQLFEIDAAPPSPLVRFPGPDAAIRESVEIRGTATDERFGYYRLDYRLRGATAWTTLADTTRISVTDGRLGDWNTRGLTDGAYELRLSVADTLGLVGTVVVPVRVDNHFPYASQTSPALVAAATGGDVYTDDAAAHLYIPPHGLSRDTIVTIAPVDTSEVPAALPGGAQRASAGYALDWGTVVMAKTATLELATGGAGNSPSVVYARGADAVWRRVGGTADANHERITVTVDRPGRYALYREADGVVTPGLARLGAITLTPRVFSPHGTYAASSVAIGFTLGRPGAVTVRVYTRTGRLVQEVAAGLNLGIGANVVRWDGRHRDGRVVEDGEYLVSIAASGETQTRVLAVVR